MQRATLLIRTILHVQAIFLMSVIFREQYVLITHLKGNEDTRNTYLTGLFVYYAITFMHKSKLLTVPTEKNKKLLVYIAPLFVLLLSSANFILQNIDIDHIMCIINGVLFPEFMLTFIYTFEPNSKL